MGLAGKLYAAAMAGASAFRKTMMATANTSDPLDFDSPDGRAGRYAVLWGLLEGTAYDKDMWAAMRTYLGQYGLYKFARPIKNPAARLVHFYRDHLWGGPLDPDAGDGSGKPSALPIVLGDGAKDTLRPAIAQVWEWSNWGVKKDQFSMLVSALGDCAIRVRDDVARGQVYLEVMHPALLHDVRLDRRGFVKFADIREVRDDPTDPNRTAVYKETMERGDGDTVFFRTFKDDSPYKWPDAPQGEDVGAEWQERYGFIPLVLGHFTEVGGPWGWSVFHESLAKFREVDSQASLLSDQVQNIVQQTWMFTGVSGEDELVLKKPLSSDGKNPQRAREAFSTIYAPDGATAIPLMFPLDIAAALAHVEKLTEGLEDDFPELGYDRLRLLGTISGQAMLVARQPAESRVKAVRAGVDKVLVSAQQMAVAIGGYRSYVGFEGYDLGSFGRGELSHEIGDRPVFEVEPAEQAEIDSLFWKAGQEAIKFGTSAQFYLEEAGWDEERIARAVAGEEAEGRRAALDLARRTLGVTPREELVEQGEESERGEE